jgi:cytochrome c oxidase assembly protein subunit 15
MAVRMRRLRNLTLTPAQYRRVADTSLVLLAMIVFTGAAVRLTGSGLGCPDWPRCHGQVIAPADTTAWIEYGNRLVSGAVGFVVLAAGLLAWRRRPLRRDLAWLAVLPVIGVGAQGVLGGLTVRSEIAPEFVMGHFGLSLLCLVLAGAVAWRARYAPGERPRATDAVPVWAVRGLLAIGTAAFFLGSVATGAGPHSGGTGTGHAVDRLQWVGPDTMTWAIHWHGRVSNAFGLCTLLVFFLLRRRGAAPELVRAVGLTAVLIAVQGTIGLLQFFVFALPSQLVWLHVVMATLTWLSLWHAVARAGRLARGRADAAGAEPREREAVPA